MSKHICTNCGWEAPSKHLEVIECAFGNHRCVADYKLQALTVCQFADLLRGLADDLPENEEIPTESIVGAFAEACGQQACREVDCGDAHVEINMYDGKPTFSVGDSPRWLDHDELTGYAENLYHQFIADISR